MDWRISSLGLIFDGLSFLSPLGLGMMGLAWYSDESFAVQAIMVSTGLFLTVVGLLKHGRMSVASSEVLMLACGFLVFLVWYEFGAIAMASTPFGDRCAEFGDPASCNMVSTVNLIESLFWPAVLAPAITFVGLALELGHRVGNSRTQQNPSLSTRYSYVLLSRCSIPQKSTNLKKLWALDVNPVHLNRGIEFFSSPNHNSGRLCETSSSTYSSSG